MVATVAASAGSGSEREEDVVAVVVGGVEAARTENARVVVATRPASMRHFGTRLISVPAAVDGLSALKDVAAYGRFGGASRIAHKERSKV